MRVLRPIAPGYYEVRVGQDLSNVLGVVIRAGNGLYDAYADGSLIDRNLVTLQAAGERVYNAQLAAVKAVEDVPPAA
jgi:hypothetical protein